MRRSSIITIILLILVIISLIVALVITNLPKTGENNDTTIENNENLEENQEEQEEPETPTSVALDSEIVEEMYMLINGATGDIFHWLKKGELTVDDLSNEYIQTIAFFYDAAKNIEEIEPDDQMRTGKLEVKYMDEAIKKVFGDVEYEPTYVLYQAGGGKILKYDSSEDIYYVYGGFGGGTNQFIHTGITNVEEYSDKYIVTEKMLIDSYEYGYHNISSYYGQGYRFTSSLGHISDSEVDSIIITQDMYSYNDKNKKILSKYYDDATEYRHTFVKNEDGSFYWQKTEIVK